AFNLERLQKEDKDKQKEADEWKAVRTEVGNRATAALSQAVGEDDLRVALPAAVALSAINRNHEAARVVGVLLRGLEDKAPRTRGEAAATLAAIARDANRRDATAEQVRRAVPALKGLVSDRAEKHPGVRARAAHALGAMGPDARPATEELSDALKDPDTEVRQQAVFALAVVGPSFAKEGELQKDGKKAVMALGDAVLDANNPDLL